VIVLTLLRRPWRTVAFFLFYLWELVEANAELAWEIVTPPYRMRPGIVRVPTRAESDVELVALANLVSFTPGTLTLEVAADRSAIFVHALFVRSPDDVRAKVQDLERRLLRVLR
jgi:multicomponent Na+:H+ antiporter subunit E